jgi:hypothetical protein
MIPKAQATKQKSKLDSTKIKNCSALNALIKKVRRQPPERRKILTNYASHKSLISRIKNYNSTIKRQTTCF